MGTERSTQTASMLTDTTTRRGALRFLAGIAFGSTGLAALGAVDANAKNKNKNKKNGKGKGKGKKQDKAVCDRRKPLARLKVSHDGKIVHTPKLEQGRHYRLRVSDLVTGTTSLQTPVGVDAGYVFNPGDPSLAQDTYGEVDFGLSVDGAAADWGDYAANHVYQRKVEGQGQKLALRLVTRADESGFNQSAQNQLVAQRIISVPDLDFTLSGSLTVEVLCD